MSHRYFIRRRSGPFDADSLREMIRGGLLDDGDEVSPDGEGWVPVRTAMALGPLTGANGGAPPREEKPSRLLESPPPLASASVIGPHETAGDADAEGEDDAADGEENDEDEAEESDDDGAEEGDEDEPEDGEDSDDDEDGVGVEPARTADRTAATMPIRAARRSPPPPPLESRVGREDTLKGAAGTLAPPEHEFTPIGPLMARPGLGTMPGYGVVPPATPIGPDQRTRPPSVIIESAAPGAAASEHTPSSASLPSTPGVRLSGERSEWSHTDMRKFFASGEAAPPVRTEEDSLGDFDTGRAKGGRRLGLLGIAIAVVAIGGLGTGAFFMWQKSRTPLRATELLAARKGTAGEKGGGVAKDEAKAAGDKGADAKDADAKSADAKGADAKGTDDKGTGDVTDPASKPAVAVADGTAKPGAEAPATADGPGAPTTAVAAGGAAPPPDRIAEYVALIAKGEKQLRAGAFGGAAKTFKEALAIHPEGAAAHAGLASAAIENGATAAAETSARKAIALDASLASPYRTLGLVFHERSKKADACANYKLYLEKGGTGASAAEAKESMKDLGCK